MSQQLANILFYEEQVRTNAEMTAVHEMRKAIRRTFTCFKLFQPYYEAGTLKPYRRSLRRIMRRLGKSRDLAVFRLKLDDYNRSVNRPLDDLAAYWETRQQIIDRMLMLYLAKPKQQTSIAKYLTFTETPAMGVFMSTDPWAPVKTRHLVPILIYKRIASVRAYDDHLQGATIRQLHRLRIQFKELRYSLQFFASSLGIEIENVLMGLKQSQEHLGDLNDTSVALQLLDETEGLASSVAIYRAYQEKEQNRLVGSFMPVWQKFDQPAWRHDLAAAIATL